MTQKKIDRSIKARPKKNKKTRSERDRTITVVVGDSIIKKIKGWELSTKDDIFVFKSFSGTKTNDMESYIARLMICRITVMNRDNKSAS